MLGFAQACVLLYTGQFEAGLRYVDEVEQRVRAQGEEMRPRLAKVTALRCIVACYQNDLAPAEDFAYQALHDLRLEDDVGEALGRPVMHRPGDVTTQILLGGEDHPRHGRRHACGRLDGRAGGFAGQVARLVGGGPGEERHRATIGQPAEGQRNAVERAPRDSDAAPWPCR